MKPQDQSPNAQEEEIGRLLSALCDGVLTADERDHLQGLIQSGPEAKLFSAVFLDLHARMLWRYRERSGSHSAAEHEEFEDGLTPPSSGKSGQSVLGFLGESIGWPVRWQISPRMLGMTVVVGLASYFAGVLVMIVIQRAQVAQPHADRRVAQPTEPARLDRFSAPQTAAAPPARQTGSLTTSSDAVELKGRSGSKTAAIEFGHRYHLTAGWAEVVLPRGTRIVFEGPSEWRFESEQRLVLDSGCLVARVPRAAVGFTVVAAVAEIVDLGTEFGVTVLDSAHAEVEVQHGSVLVRPQGGGTAPAPVHRLVAGESQRFAPDSNGQTTVQSFVGGSNARYRRLSLLPAAAATAPRDAHLAPSGKLLPSRVAKMREEDWVDHSSEHAYPVSSTDLINQGEPSLLSVETSLPVLSDGSRAEMLNDGTVGIDSALGIKTALPTGAWVDDKPWSVTFHLRGAYDIDQIDTYAGWEQYRISQSYRVFVSTDPERKIFSEFPLADVDFSADTGTSRVQLTAEGGGPIALGVTAIRFEIAMPGGNRGFSTVFREIDVFGSSVAGARRSPGPDDSEVQE